MRYVVRTVSKEEVAPADVAAWSDLEARAIEPNAYLSPHFVLPALRHLDPQRRVLLVLVERASPGSRALVGVGAFCPVAATRAFPVPHLVAYLSRHSFLSGLLVDRECADECVTAFFAHLRRHRWRWHGVEFETAWADGNLADLLGRHARPHSWDPKPRAILMRPSDGERYLQDLPNSRDVKRQTRRLHESGTVEWRGLRVGGIPPAAVEAFLDLEHDGWKGETGESLRSQPADTAFFREMVAGFAREERAIFSELRLNNVIIASTSNMVSGKTGFAFKLGWKQEHAKLSPGKLLELEFIRHANELWGDVDWFDSGASPGSYLERIWRDKRPLATWGYATSPLGSAALTAVGALRQIKRPRIAAPVPGAPATADE